MNNLLTPELPDFDDPIGMLEACHQRLLAQCDTLEQLVIHIAAQGVDDEARTAITRVIHYFTTSAVHHHQDEEIDLFPLLNGQSLKISDVIHKLTQEHAQLNTAWASLFNDLRNASALAENREFPAHVATFCEQYRAHIKIEESELFFMARHFLSHEQLESSGKAMAKRRGL